MALVTWKRGFRELTTDGWTETDNGDGSFTYTVPQGGPKDAEVVWGQADRQPHMGMPPGSSIRFWPETMRARIEKA